MPGNEIMAETISIQQISPETVAAFKAARLTALQDVPTAFGRTSAEESLFTDDDWLNRIGSWSNGHSSIVYIAMAGTLPCGIVAGHLDKQNPRLAHLLSMWVAEPQRRTGLGTLLVDAVRVWAEQRAVQQLMLDVTSNNYKAMRFYERLGFTRNGVTEPYPNDPNLFIYKMVKNLPG
jgi:ribosomal protein S18 acetylase RimI-like enzyme